MRAKLVSPIALCVAALSAAALPLSAQEADKTAPVIALELNQATPTASGCKLTFVARNSLSADVDKLVLETVLFDTSGQVSLMTLFDFEAIPANTPRVRQFELPGATCDTIESILINGLQTCETAADTGCAGALTTSSRIKIGLIG